MQVIVRDNNVEQALKALKKKLQREGVFREMKLRRHYEKPSERRAREGRRGHPPRPQGGAQAAGARRLLNRRRGHPASCRARRAGSTPARRWCVRAGRSSSATAVRFERASGSETAGGRKTKGREAGASRPDERAGAGAYFCSACTISCVTFLASPNSIVGVGAVEQVDSPPRHSLCVMLRLTKNTVLARSTSSTGMP